jgi:hypothetical protein
MGWISHKPNHKYVACCSGTADSTILSFSHLTAYEHNWTQLTLASLFSTSYMPVELHSWLPEYCSICNPNLIFHLYAMVILLCCYLVFKLSLWDVYLLTWCSWDVYSLFISTWFLIPKSSIVCCNNFFLCRLPQRQIELGKANPHLLGIQYQLHQ